MNSTNAENDIIHFQKGVFVILMSGSGFFTFISIAFIVIVSIFYFCFFRKRLAQIQTTQPSLTIEEEMTQIVEEESPRRIIASDDYFTLENGVMISIPPRYEIQSSPPSSVEDLTSRCCICFTRKPKIVIDDCGHLTLCDSSRCLNTCGTNCPICRKPIKKFIRVYNT